MEGDSPSFAIQACGGAFFIIGRAASPVWRGTPKAPLLHAT